MANEKELRAANNAYETVCAGLDKMNWKYERHDNDRVVSFGVNGEDIPMQMIIVVDAERQLIRLLSKLPFAMEQERRVEGSIITNCVNYRLADGSFDFDLGDGSIVFRLAASYRASLIDPELIRYMCLVACSTIDKYNDRFMMVNKGLMSVSEFLDKD